MYHTRFGHLKNPLLLLFYTFVHINKKLFIISYFSVKKKWTYTFYKQVDSDSYSLVFNLLLKLKSVRFSVNPVHFSVKPVLSSIKCIRFLIKGDLNLYINYNIWFSNEAILTVIACLFSNCFMYSICEGNTVGQECQNKVRLLGSVICLL